MALTDKQQRFVAEYGVDLNATQAAIRAGYSKKTAEQQGSRLLRNVEVAAAITAAKAKQAAAVDLRAEDVLRELMRIGFADIGQLLDESGKTRALHEIPVELRRAISSIEIEVPPTVSRVLDDGPMDVKQLPQIVKVKFWDKNAALTNLAKNLKLLTDRVEHDVSESLESLVLASMKRDSK